MEQANILNSRHVFVSSFEGDLVDRVRLLKYKSRKHTVTFKIIA